MGAFGVHPPLLICHLFSGHPQNGRAATSTTPDSHNFC
jgi:hypothetical protein